MSQILNEVLAANERYAATFGGKAKLIIPPARHFAVLTCMARLDPAKFAGLAEGDAHSSATPAAAPARMPFGPWSFLTNCSEPANGLSFIILIAAWSFSRIKPYPNCSRRAWRRRDWKRSRRRPR